MSSDTIERASVTRIKLRSDASKAITTPLLCVNLDQHPAELIEVIRDYYDANFDRFDPAKAKISAWGIVSSRCYFRRTDPSVTMKYVWLNCEGREA